MQLAHNLIEKNILSTMKSYLCFLLTAVGTGVAAKSLRKGNDEKTLTLADEAHRELFFGDPLCEAIQEAFTQEVACHCDFSYLGGGIGYNCHAVHQACVDTTFETYCSTPVYKGTLEWHMSRSTFNLNSTVCSDHVRLTTSPLGNGEMADLCVYPGFCVEERGNHTDVSVCSCEATYGGSDCEECTICTTDYGELGIQVGCGSVHSPVCMPFSTPFSEGLGVPERGTINPFIPQLVVSEE